MGHTFSAICLDCNHKFWLDDGGGMNTYQVRCQTCGKGMQVATEEAEEAILGHELDFVRQNATQEQYQKFAARPAFKGIKPLTDEEFPAVFVKAKGPCECGGLYAMNAPARCSKCHSTNIKTITVVACYD